ncbi:MAG: RES family NAD+ phosphorylase [Pseudomonadota bacterium]
MSDVSAARRPLGGELWRMVEAQHRVSTLKLVDDLEEQRTLEELLDPTKPPVPAACAHLHWLLFTPFRYEARGESRFRRTGPTPPVFYASESVRASAAEKAFWKLLFFLESPETPWPANPMEETAFVVRYRADAALDLTRAPFDARAADWMHPTDYAACHDIADAARAAGAQAIRSASARDPEGGVNVTLLACAAFAKPAPIAQTTWRLRLSAAGVSAWDEAGEHRIDFGREAFARDPRIAALNWQR